MKKYIVFFLILFIYSNITFSSQVSPQKETINILDFEDPKVQLSLGIIYFLGQGVEQDFNEAFKWFKLSAEQAYAPAQVMLGTMYEKGYGVEINHNEALKWFKLPNKALLKYKIY